jgi:hypothetical protein
LRNERIQRLNAPADVVDLGRSRRRKADGGVQADQPGTLPDAEDGLVPTPGPGNKSDPALGHDNPDLISGINPNQVLGSLRSGCCVSGLYLEVAPDLHQDFTEIDEDRADTDMRPRLYEDPGTVNETEHSYRLRTRADFVAWLQAHVVLHWRANALTNDLDPRDRPASDQPTLHDSVQGD